MTLYEEESQGLEGPEKISTRWPARCHVTYHVHVAELKETAPVPPPYQHILVKEIVVFKEFKHLRRTGHSYRPIGPLLQINKVNWGFLSY